MKRSSGRVRWIAAAVASCGAATALAVAAQTASAAQAAPASHSVVIVSCTGKAQVGPSSYVLACADYGDYLTGVHWVSWKNVAFGRATEHIENCYPYCASSGNRWYSYPVLLTLWRAKPRPGHVGQAYFTRLTEIRTGSLKLPHDPSLSRTYTWGLASWNSAAS
jgi:hypothetical protein